MTRLLTNRITLAYLVVLILWIGASVLIRGFGAYGHLRYLVELSAVMRGDQINDAVAIVELGPGGLVCRQAPFIAKGEQVELVIEDGDYCYRFRAQGKWLRDDGDDYKVGLQFIGMPFRH